MNLFDYDGWLWVTQDGREINLVDMEDEHLVNTMRMLRRRAGLLAFRKDFIYYLKHSKPTTGTAGLLSDSAKLNVFAIQDVDFLIRYVPIYDKMLLIEHDRGLDSRKEPEKNKVFREAYNKTLERLRNNIGGIGPSAVVNGRRLIV